MNVSDSGENRVNTASERAKNFFAMLSERRTEAQEEARLKRQVQKARPAKYYLQEKRRVAQERKKRRFQRKVRPFQIHRREEPLDDPPEMIPRPASRPSIPPEPCASKPATPMDWGTREFLKWCFGKDEEEVDPTLPPWGNRCSGIYGKGTGGR